MRDCGYSSYMPSTNVPVAQNSSAMLNERSRAYFLLTFGVLLLELRSSSAGKTLNPEPTIALSFPHSQDTLKKMSVLVGS